MSVSATAAFVALGLAAGCLWVGRSGDFRRPLRVWLLPGVFSLAMALVGGLIDAGGLLAILVLATAAATANRTGSLWAHGIVLALTAGLFLHAVPGFANPRVLNEVIVGADSLSYTKYLNFDKGAAGLILLGVYVPERIARDDGWRHVRTLPWRLLVLVIAVMAAALAVGLVRWDPKVPEWWPLWLWSMVLLTALPEEAAFRGVIQTWIARRRGENDDRLAITVAGLLFGLAHAAGGPAYVLVASVAGVGYGWIYARTRSLGSAIVAHTTLNAAHLLLFSYPALAP